MIRPSEELPVNALLTAAQNGDTEEVSRIWRELPPGEQESVLLTLLQTQVGTASDEASPESDEGLDPSLGDTAAMDRVEQTDLIPEGLEELRGLTVSEGGDDAALAGKPVQNERAYWSRWRRRWRLSALVAAWAVTTVFAFTADTSTFGPMEWLVALFGTVVGGGVLVGTLVNFAVAAISATAQDELNESEIARP
ncbi:MAG TPA: hypothetical protein VJ782_09020 [Aeromicrobium sp.]|nr:hypothetical protein [Aeromicrobium sp.]